MCHIKSKLNFKKFSPLASPLVFLDMSLSSLQIHLLPANSHQSPNIQELQRVNDSSFSLPYVQKITVYSHRLPVRRYIFATSCLKNVWAVCDKRLDHVHTRESGNSPCRNYSKEVIRQGHKTYKNMCKNILGMIYDSEKGKKPLKCLIMRYNAALIKSYC